jgi:hypothetical protein
MDKFAVLAYEYNLIDGRTTAEGMRFAPRDEVTLAEVVTIAARLHAVYTYGTADAIGGSGSPWYKRFVDYAIKYDIIVAEFDNMDARASRGDFVSIVSAAIPAEEFEALREYDDNFDDLEGYEDSIILFYEAGIINGLGGGKFGSGASIIRQEVAVILARVVDEDIVDGKYNIFDLLHPVLHGSTVSNMISLYTTGTDSHLGFDGPTVSWDILKQATGIALEMPREPSEYVWIAFYSNSWNWTGGQRDSWGGTYADGVFTLCFKTLTFDLAAVEPHPESGLYQVKIHFFTWRENSFVNWGVTDAWLVFD